MFMCGVNLESVNKLDLTWKQSFLIMQWRKKLILLDAMDKLKLTGQNLGRVCNSKLVHALYMSCNCIHNKMA
jgi:hypothetical protein